MLLKAYANLSLKKEVPKPSTPLYENVLLKKKKVPKQLKRSWRTKLYTSMRSSLQIAKINMPLNMHEMITLISYLFYVR
jgi:hypothetical protein